MATSSYDSIHRVGVTTFSLAAGITTASAYIPPTAYLISTRISYVTGGTLLLIGTDVGVTLASATLAVSDVYQVPTTSIIIEGPAPFYLAAAGVTTTVSLLFNYSQGASLGL